MPRIGVFKRPPPTKAQGLPFSKWVLSSPVFHPGTLTNRPLKTVSNMFFRGDLLNLWGCTFFLLEEFWNSLGFSRSWQIDQDQEHSNSYAYEELGGPPISLDGWFFSAPGGLVSKTFHLHPWKLEETITDWHVFQMAGSDTSYSCNMVTKLVFSQNSWGNCSPCSIGFLPWASGWST